MQRPGIFVFILWKGLNMMETSDEYEPKILAHETMAVAETEIK